MIVNKKQCNNQRYLLDLKQRLDNTDVVQVDPASCVPVLNGGAVLRDSQPLQELQQVVMIVVDDAVYRTKGAALQKHDILSKNINFSCQK